MYIFILLPFMVVFSFLSMCFVGLQSEHIELDKELTMAVYAKAGALAIGFISFIMMLPGSLFTRRQSSLDSEKQRALVLDQYAASATCAAESVLMNVVKPAYGGLLNADQQPWVVHRKSLIATKLLEVSAAMVDKVKQHNREKNRPLFRENLPAGL